MIKGDYEFLQNLAKFNICARCGQPVSVAWNAEEKSYVLRCTDCPYPDSLTKEPSLTELWKQGEEIPEPIKSNIEKGQRRRSMTEEKQVIPFELQGVPGHDLATGELLSKGQMVALVDYARRYQLDPMRGHVCLMYGKPYITIDGYLYHGHRTERPFSLIGQPLTTEELKVRGYIDEDLGFRSVVTFLDTMAEFEGFGFIRKEEMEELAKGKVDTKRYPVVASKPGNMVQKRA